DRGPHGLDGRARVERVQAHLPRVVEVVDAKVRDDDRRTAPQPATLPADALGLLGAAEIAGARPKVDLVDETPRALAHDHEDLPRVDRDLARPAAAGQARGRVLVVADDRRVDVAEPVDLRGAEEPDVD